MGGLQTLHIENLKAEIKGLKWAIKEMRKDYVKLHNKYRRKKIKTLDKEFN